MTDIARIAAQVGFLYGPFALAIYFAFIVMSIPDLSIEGSFGLGGGVFASQVAGGNSPYGALAFAVGVGIVVGLVASILHSRARLNPLLVGILVSTAAWSINLRLMGRANISLLKSHLLIDDIERYGIDRSTAILISGVGTTAVVGAALVWFLSTRVGLTLLASGRNIATARSLGVPTERRQMMALAIANGLAALSGTLVVQANGFADVQSQLGTVVIGIAAIMIGSSLIRGRSILSGVAAVALGVFLYRFFVGWALDLGLPATDIRLVTSVLVLVALLIRAKGRGWLLGFGGSARSVRRRQNTNFLESDVVTPIL